MFLFRHHPKIKSCMAVKSGVILLYMMQKSVGEIQDSCLSVRQTYLLMNTDPGRGTYYLKRASQQDARQFLSYPRKFRRKVLLKELSTFGKEVHPNGLNPAMKSLLNEGHLSVLVQFSTAWNSIFQNELVPWHRELQLVGKSLCWFSLPNLQWPVLGMQVRKFCFYSKFFLFRNERGK